MLPSVHRLARVEGRRSGGRHLVGRLRQRALKPPAKPTIAPTSSGALSEKAKQEQRQAILKVRTGTLNQLYKLKPLTRSEIEQAAGYGVFEINGLNAVLAGKHGRGVVHEKAVRSPTCNWPAPISDPASR